MFQNMVYMVNASYQPIQHNLDTLKQIMINEEIPIVGISEVNSNWGKIPMKRIYIIGQMDGLKQELLEQDITKLLILMDHFKVEAQTLW